MPHGKSHHLAVLCITVCGLLALILLSARGSKLQRELTSAQPSEAANLIEKHIDFYGRKLQIGMSKEEALAFLPKPQNTNGDNVCVSADDSTETVRTERFDWQWLQATRGGYFLIFVDGRLATPLCANAAFNPWQALRTYTRLTSEQAEQVLGPEPR